MREPIGTIYYGRAGVYVTERALVCAGRTVPLSRLTNVHTVRSGLPASTLNAGLAAAVIAFVLVVAGGMLDAAAWVGGLIVLSVPVAVALVGATRPRAYELWADVATATAAGAPTVIHERLLHEPDAERYRQICRALLRAREHGRS
jgi:Family of unknown function (DUF6232)